MKSQYAALVGARISAVAGEGDIVYTGSEDGRIWVSIDGGRSFRQSPLPEGTSGKVERIFADSAEPRVALAALSGGGTHLLRTTNTGTFWDSLDGNLPDAPARGVTAERASGAIYLATDKGVFYAQADLENPSAGPVVWTALTENLPAAPATDARLDPAGVQLYISLDGYGVFATAAPHRARSLKIVNAADFSTRPAAPGSLLSIVGARVSEARAATWITRCWPCWVAIPRSRFRLRRLGQRGAGAHDRCRHDHPGNPRAARFAGHSGGPRWASHGLRCR